MPTNPSTRGRGAIALIAMALVVCHAAAAFAQGHSSGTAVSTDTPPHAAGWVFTPGLVYSGSYDDNVLLHGEGDSTEGDFLTVLNPKGALGYTGRHTEFDLNYDGAFLLYRSLNSLNSFDQHGALSGQWQATKRVTFFVRDAAALTPTTDAVEFVGVPFLRTGSKINDLRGGVTTILDKRTVVTGAATIDWVAFDDKGVFGSQFLRGGRSLGGSASVRRQLSARISALGDYDLQHGVVNGFPDAFDVQNASIGAEYRLTELTRISGAVGVSHLSVSTFGPARTGPAYRAALTRDFRKAGLDLSYSRSFVPSYGFGGTTQNEDATARARLPLSRRMTAQTAVSWRRNEPLTQGDLRLKSWWIEGAIGYGLTPWMRVEGFYNGARQTIDRPGGVLNRNHIGFQIVMEQPMRIQ